jgi:Holliday junction resolvase
MKHTKRKGARNERKSMRIFESTGYVCMKAGGSLGVFDFIGIGAKDIILCQVKSNVWPGPVEMELIKNFIAPDNARKLVHRWRDYQRLPDVREL